MELAKVTSKGQITIPVDIRRRLRLKPGDKVLFVEAGDKVIMENSSLVALTTFQNEMDGEADRAGIMDEDNVVELIEEIRTAT